MAVDVLKSRGVPEDRILFLNLIASPEGVTSFAKRFPKLRVVTAFVDQGLDDKKYRLHGSLFAQLNLTHAQLYCPRSWRFWGSLLYLIIIAGGVSRDVKALLCWLYELLYTRRCFLVESREQRCY